jgi:hypothetical protein
MGAAKSKIVGAASAALVAGGEERIVAAALQSGPVASEVARAAWIHTGLHRPQPIRI